MISKKKKGKKNLVQSLTDLGIVLNCTNLDGFFVNKVITKESDMLKDTTVFNPYNREIVPSSII